MWTMAVYQAEPLCIPLTSAVLHLYWKLNPARVTKCSFHTDLHLEYKNDLEK